MSRLCLFFKFCFIISSLFCVFLFYLRQLASEEHFFNMLDNVHSDTDTLLKYSSFCTSVIIFTMIFHLSNFWSTKIMYILNWCSTNIFCWTSDSGAIKVRWAHFWSQSHFYKWICSGKVRLRSRVGLSKVLWPLGLIGIFMILHFVNSEHPDRNPSKMIPCWEISILKYRNVF